MNNDLKKINGKEIIDFLNKISIDEDWLDISIDNGSYVFESQGIEDDKYVLKFTGDFNNWGTHQAIHGNKIIISKNSVYLSLKEPFDGDESIEEALTKWLVTHTFNENYTEDFYNIITDVYESLQGLSIIDKDRMDNIINQLIKAKTLMK